MQTSFLRKTLIADEQNSAIHIPTEWYGTKDDKINTLNSLLNFADNHKVIEKDFIFDRESCYDR